MSKHYIVYISVDVDPDGTWYIFGKADDTKTYRLAHGYATELDAWKRVAANEFASFVIAPVEKSIAKTVVEHLESTGKASTFILASELLPE